MTLRVFKHAVTGRSMQVREGSRAERLVEADGNWTEDNPRKADKEADDGSGDAAGRGGVARKATQRKRGGTRHESAGEG